MDEKWGWSGAVGAAIVVSIFACIAISASGGWPIVQGAFVCLLWIWRRQSWDRLRISLIAPILRRMLSASEYFKLSKK